MRNIFYFLPILLLSFSPYSQNKMNVSGLVKSKEGSVLAGATVVCYDLNTKDSSKVKSKEDSSFNLAANEGACIYINVS